jgi:hypothetical protein
MRNFGASMKLGPFDFAALFVALVLIIVETGTWDLHHELTYFGSLSSYQSEHLRLALRVLLVPLVVAAYLEGMRRRRQAHSKTQSVR